MWLFSVIKAFFGCCDVMGGGVLSSGMVETLVTSFLAVYLFYASLCLVVVVYDWVFMSSFGVKVRGLLALFHVRLLGLYLVYLSSSLYQFGARLSVALLTSYSGDLASSVFSGLGSTASEVGFDSSLVKMMVQSVSAGKTEGVSGIGESGWFGLSKNEKPSSLVPPSVVSWLEKEKGGWHIPFPKGGDSVPSISSAVLAKFEGGGPVSFGLLKGGAISATSSGSLVNVSPSSSSSSLLEDGGGLGFGGLLSFIWSSVVGFLECYGSSDDVCYGGVSSDETFLKTVVDPVSAFGFAGSFSEGSLPSGSKSVVSFPSGKFGDVCYRSPSFSSSSAGVSAVVEKAKGSWSDVCGESLFGLSDVSTGIFVKPEGVVTNLVGSGALVDAAGLLARAKEVSSVGAPVSDFSESGSYIPEKDSVEWLDTCFTCIVEDYVDDSPSKARKALKEVYYFLLTNPDQPEAIFDWCPDSLTESMKENIGHYLVLMMKKFNFEWGDESDNSSSSDMSSVEGDGVGKVVDGVFAKAEESVSSYYSASDDEGCVFGRLVYVEGPDGEVICGHKSSSSVVDVGVGSDGPVPEVIDASTDTGSLKGFVAAQGFTKSVVVGSDSSDVSHGSATVGTQVNNLEEEGFVGSSGAGVFTATVGTQVDLSDSFVLKGSKAEVGGGVSSVTTGVGSDEPFCMVSVGTGCSEMVDASSVAVPCTSEVGSMAVPSMVTTGSSVSAPTMISEGVSNMFSAVSVMSGPDSPIPPVAEAGSLAAPSVVSVGSGSGEAVVSGVDVGCGDAVVLSGASVVGGVSEVSDDSASDTVKHEKLDSVSESFVGDWASDSMSDWASAPDVGCPESLLADWAKVPDVSFSSVGAASKESSWKWEGSVGESGGSGQVLEASDIVFPPYANIVKLGDVLKEVGSYSVHDLLVLHHEFLEQVLIYVDKTSEKMLNEMLSADGAGDSDSDDSTTWSSNDPFKYSVSTREILQDLYKSLSSNPDLKKLAPWCSKKLCDAVQADPDYFLGVMRVSFGEETFATPSGDELRETPITAALKMVCKGGKGKAMFEMCEEELSEVLKEAASRFTDSAAGNK